ncbi:hypothetical protein OESDEN_20591 [Oesophagostomum dentatum]|uniref:Sre G protein-coupled chemoreceptor n=1 Tax=Oesophagostomum dentatum TaxID=61180 RepID=A0A0B1S336_OESDE|nr:hypothetical protein OESDEN_20591 [Oesophagostomum dentatum]
MIGMNLSIFSWLFVIVERAIATAFLGKYESKCNGCIAPFLLCSAAISVAAFLCCASLFNLIGNFYKFYVGLQIFVIVLCFVALAVIVLFNISAYRKRHNSMMKLTNRYQLDENIRGGRYLIPVALNDVLVKVVFILLICYSIFFTNIPLGYDTTHLSHAYDIVARRLPTSVFRIGVNNPEPKAGSAVSEAKKDDESAGKAGYGC